MMYAKIRFMALLGALVWIGVGTTLSLSALQLNDYSFEMRIAMTLAGVTLAVIVGLTHARKFWTLAHKLQHQTYDWYRQNNPAHTHSHGVSCNSCGNKRIHVRALMGGLYHREHFCTQCGQALYYSPEANT